MDVFQCISDVTEIKSDIQTFLAQNVTVEALIQEFYTLEPLIQNALTDCGVTNVSIADMMATRAENVPVSFDFLRCLSDLNSLVTLLGQVTADITTGNIMNIIQDLVSLRTAAVALGSDCSPVNVTLKASRGRVLAESPVIFVDGALDCFSDITEKLIPDLENFVNVSKSGQIADIIVQLNVVLADAKAVIADCSVSTFLNVDSFVQHLNTLSPIDCLSDVSNLVNLAETIVSNFNNSQYQELISNLVQFVNAAQQAVSDCTSFNVTLAKARDMILNNEQTIECAGELNNFNRQVRGFITVSNDEKSAQLRNVFGSVKTMLPICGIKNCPVVNRILRIDPFACFGDLENVVSLASQLVNDTENYDIVSVISDVEELVSQVETAIVDCTGSNGTLTKKLTTDIIQCVGDVEFEVELINNLLNEIKAGNFSDVLPTVSSIVNNFNTLAQDCGLNTTIESIESKLHFSPEECINDVGYVVDVVNQVIADYQAQNWSQLFNDVVSAVQVVQQLSADCFNYNLSSIINNDCLDDVQYVINDVVEVFNKISNSTLSLDEIMQIVEDLSRIAQEVETLESDCGLNLTLLVANGNAVTSFLGPRFQGNTCIASIQKLGGAFVEILEGTDYMEKVNQIAELKGLVAETKANCLGQTVVITPETIVSYVQAKGLRL